MSFLFGRRRSSDTDAASTTHDEFDTLKRSSSHRHVPSDHQDYHTDNGGLRSLFRRHSSSSDPTTTQVRNVYFVVMTASSRRKRKKNSHLQLRRTRCPNYEEGVVADQMTAKISVDPLSATRPQQGNTLSQHNLEISMIFSITD